MKKLGYGIIAIMVLLLGGCIQEQQEVGGNTDDASLKNKEIVALEDEVIIEDASIEKEEITDTLSISVEHLLVDEFVERSQFESNDYLSIGETVALNYGANGDGKWEVTLEGYEIGNDDVGSDRKALVLLFNHKNISSGTGKIEGYFNAMEPAVIYKDMKLGLQDFTETIIAYNNDSTGYLDGNRIGYGGYEGYYYCKQVGFIKEGNIENCYTYYSYAGPGDYLISFNDVTGSQFIYLLTVE